MASNLELKNQIQVILDEKGIEDFPFGESNKILKEQLTALKTDPTEKKPPKTGLFVVAEGFSISGDRLYREGEDISIKAVKGDTESWLDLKTNKTIVAKG